MAQESLLKIIWKEKNYDEREILYYKQQFKLSDVSARIAVTRNNILTNPEDFFNPTLKNLMPDPSSLLDLDKATEVVIQHIKRGSKIVIFGDYDVDGATSTSLLLLYFRLCGYNNIDFYIPNRMKEGYGPSVTAFEKILKTGANLIITVDCGSLAFEPIKYARENNIDVIVIDHHQTNAELPIANAIINPNRIDENNSLKNLAAVGVCFMFIVNLNRYIKLNDNIMPQQPIDIEVINLLDIVALGTIADVVDINGLNRAYVAQGIRIMRKRNNIGIAALMDAAGINSPVDAYHLGFMLGPRINAAGRLSDASIGVKLLTTNDRVEAIEIADKLNKLNNERQTIESLVVEEALEQIEQNPGFNDSGLIYSYGDWHEGVIGIVASKIKEKYNKPVAIISLSNGLGKGSARSVVGVDFGAAIANSLANGLIIKGGGHAMAAGFTLQEEKLLDLYEFLNKEFLKFFNPYAKLQKYYDLAISANSLNENLYNDMQALWPFGVGNEEPVIIIRSAKLANINIINNSHIKFNIITNFGMIKGISFKTDATEIGDFLLNINNIRGNILDLVGKIQFSYWHGRYNIEFLLQDIIPINFYSSE